MALLRVGKLCWWGDLVSLSEHVNKLPATGCNLARLFLMRRMSLKVSSIYNKFDDREARSEVAVLWLSDGDRDDGGEDVPT